MFSPLLSVDRREIVRDQRRQGRGLPIVSTRACPQHFNPLVDPGMRTEEHGRLVIGHRQGTHRGEKFRRAATVPVTPQQQLQPGGIGFTLLIATEIQLRQHRGTADKPLRETGAVGIADRNQGQRYDDTAAQAA